jgi:hypothetical protein
MKNFLAYPASCRVRLTHATRQGVSLRLNPTTRFYRRSRRWLTNTRSHPAWARLPYDLVVPMALSAQNNLASDIFLMAPDN